jgi:hypothetical protein
MAPFGLRLGQSALDAVPIDLLAPIPDPLTEESYRTLPLAARNAVIVKILSRRSGDPEEEIARALPVMMGRQALDSQAGIQRALEIGGRAARSGQPRGLEALLTVLQGELYLAVLLCVPRDDRNRAAIERNLAKVGARLDSQFVMRGLLSTRFPRLDLTVGQIFNRAAEGQMDLAFAVGTIRKAAERTAEEMAKIR